MSASERSRELFGAALAIPDSERSGFLERACGADSALRSEVESLLRSHAAAGSLLDDGPGAASGALPPPAAADRRIGPYRVLRPLASGGMGSILLAVRDDGSVRRRVAIKLVRDDIDSAELLRRFHAERRALAALEHPGIARYVDSGVDESGRP